MATQDTRDPRECPICGTAYPTPYKAQQCAERKPPGNLPDFRTTDRLRLKAEVYAKRFTGEPIRWPADQNLFAVKYDLSGSQSAVAASRVIRFDAETQSHRYQVLVRWLGNVTDGKANRQVWVWADDLYVDPDLTPVPQAHPNLK